MIKDTSLFGTIKDTSIFQGVCEFKVGGTEFRCQYPESKKNEQPVSVAIKRGNGYVFDRHVITTPTPSAIFLAWCDAEGQ